MSGTGENVKIAIFNGEPLARMWAEALRQEGVPAAVWPDANVLAPEWSSSLKDSHSLYVPAPEEEHARALIPQEFQVFPPVEQPSEPTVNVRVIVILVCLALMGVLLWVAFFR